MHVMHMAVAVILRCNAHLIVHGEQQPNFEQEVSPSLWRRHPQRAADPFQVPAATAPWDIFPEVVLTRLWRKSQDWSQVVRTSFKFPQM